jgi:hypothetical protein
MRIILFETNKYTVKTESLQCKTDFQRGEEEKKTKTKTYGFSSIWGFVCLKLLSIRLKCDSAIWSLGQLPGAFKKQTSNGWTNPPITMIELRV